MVSSEEMIEVRFTRMGVEEVFANAHSIDPSRRAAFRARLRHLQRLGVPPGTNTGKGKAAVYGPNPTIYLAFALELLELGISPERAAKLLLEVGELLLEAAAEAILQFAKQADKYMLFDPSGLADLRAVGSDDGGHQRVAFTTGRFQLERTDAHAAVINVSATMKKLAAGISHVFRSPQEKLLRRWAEEWMSDDSDPEA